MITGILWVSYARDIEFFKVSAKSYSKFATGWDFAKCVVPNVDLELFQPICEANGITIAGFEEAPGKGMLHHQIMVCRADEHLPEAEVIFHIDSDVVFATPTQPTDFLPSGRIFLPFTDFSNLLSTPVRPNEMIDFMGFSGRRMDFHRGQYNWKFCADFALGLEVPRATMMAWPVCHHREVYGRTRAIIESRFKRKFNDYVLSCRNEFPQTFCEFETLGGVAYHYFEDRYHWHNIHVLGNLVPKLVAAWSHGGLHRPHHFPGEYGGFQTPFQLYRRLGLL